MYVAPYIVKLCTVLSTQFRRWFGNTCRSGKTATSLVEHRDYLLWALAASRARLAVGSFAGLYSKTILSSCAFSGTNGEDIMLGVELPF